MAKVRVEGIEFLGASADSGQVTAISIGFQDKDYPIPGPPWNGGEVDVPPGVAFNIKVTANVHVDTIGADGYGAMAITVKGDGPLANNTKCFFKYSPLLPNLHDFGTTATFGPFTQPSGGVVISRIRVWTSGTKTAPDIPASAW
jgi:hypothetical protein